MLIMGPRQSIIHKAVLIVPATTANTWFLYSLVLWMEISNVFLMTVGQGLYPCGLHLRMKCHKPVVMVAATSLLLLTMASSSVSCCGTQAAHLAGCIIIILTEEKEVTEQYWQLHDLLPYEYWDLLTMPFILRWDLHLLLSRDKQVFHRFFKNVF